MIWSRKLHFQRPARGALNCFFGCMLSHKPLLHLALSALTKQVTCIAALLLTVMAPAGAGYDTSAVTMTWAMYLIAQHPEVSLAPPPYICPTISLVGAHSWQSRAMDGLSTDVQLVSS